MAMLVTSFSSFNLAGDKIAGATSQDRRRY